METEQQNQNRHPSEDKPWLFKPGQSGNPNGRPKGKTLKEYAREWFLNMSDEQKMAYLLALEEKRPAFAWSMAEGLPQEDKKVSITVPRPILGGATGAINQAVTDEVLDNSSSNHALEAPETVDNDAKSE